MSVDSLSDLSLYGLAACLIYVSPYAYKLLQVNKITSCFLFAPVVIPTITFYFPPDPFSNNTVLIITYP